jgi:hypothetical protein
MLSSSKYNLFNFKSSFFGGLWIAKHLDENLNNCAALSVLCNTYPPERYAHIRTVKFNEK